MDTWESDLFDERQFRQFKFVFRVRWNFVKPGQMESFYIVKGTESAENFNVY